MNLQQQMPTQISAGGKTLAASRRPTIIAAHSNAALNLEDDAQSDISEITGIASWMQDIHDANDGDGEDYDDQITLVEHHRRVGTGRTSISARDIATRAAATRGADRDVNRRLLAGDPNAKSAPTNRRASVDRLTSNQ